MTYNRGKLKREIEKGLWLVKCDGVYTDDYAFDNEYNYQKTNYLKPIVFPDFWDWLEEKGLTEEYSQAQQSSDFITENKHRKYAQMHGDEKKAKGEGIFFDNRDFTGYGRAWSNEDGTVVLSFGNYKSYTFKRK